jgi:transglutaminase/protease-like cytokinesis protein 3
MYNKDIAPGDLNSSLNYDFTEIDQHALSTPENEESSIESLAAYLTKPAKNDMEKARAIYRWVTKNIDYNVQGLFEGDYGNVSAEGVLKSRRSVCSGYSNIFEKLANESGLKTVIISGYAKGYNYTPGMRFSGQTDHAWNAVKIDGKWYLIDSTWGAGWLGVDKKYHREFNDYYFLTSPKEFINRHFP